MASAKKRTTKPRRKSATKQQDESLRWEHYRSIPQKHWREMSGRQAKVLIEQAERYGIPFDGATVDLPVVVHALHDFFASNAAALSASEADRQFKVARAGREELRLLKEKGELISVKDHEKLIMEYMRWMVGIFERAGTETSTMTAGKRPAEHRTLVNEYYRNIRADACKRAEACK